MGGWGRHKVISQHVITKIYLIYFLFEVILLYIYIFWKIFESEEGGGGTAHMGATAIYIYIFFYIYIYIYLLF